MPKIVKEVEKLLKGHGVHDSATRRIEQYPGTSARRKTHMFARAETKGAHVRGREFVGRKGKVSH